MEYIWGTFMTSMEVEGFVEALRSTTVNFLFVMFHKPIYKSDTCTVPFGCTAFECCWVFCSSVPLLCILTQCNVFRERIQILKELNKSKMWCWSWPKFTFFTLSLFPLLLVWKKKRGKLLSLTFLSTLPWGSLDPGKLSHDTVPVIQVTYQGWNTIINPNQNPKDLFYISTTHVG